MDEAPRPGAHGTRVGFLQPRSTAGALIEFVAGSLATPDAAARMDRYAQAIRAVGAESCVLSSDLGQRGNALPPDGLAAFLAALRSRGLSDQDLDRMSKRNPARLLGLP